MALPSTYKKVKCIESTGTQYINTGIIPVSNIRIEADFRLTEAQSTGGIISAELTWQSNMCSIDAWAYRYGTGYQQHTLTANERYKVILDNGVFTENGTQVFTASGSVSTSIPLTIFAVNRGDSQDEFAKARLYSAKITTNGTLVRDFIPCVSPSGEVGLYDDVSGIFFGNSGTGTLVAVTNEFITKTDTVTLHPASYVADDYNYTSSKNLSNPIGQSTSNTTYSTITLKNVTRPTTAYIYYQFDTSQIPENVTIKSISCNIKANITSPSTGSGTSSDVYEAQMFSGTTAKGSATTLSYVSSPTAQALTVGSWTRDELNDCRIKLSITSSYVDQFSYYGIYIDFYGADLTITYEYTEGSPIIDLPDTNIDHIQTYGKQWIDTQYKPTNLTSLELDFELAMDMTSTYVPIFGAIVSGGRYYVMVNNSQYDLGWGANEYLSSAGVYKSGRNVVKIDAGSLYVNGTKVATATASTFSYSYNILLSGFSSNGTPYEALMPPMRIYSCKIYEDGTLVRDLIPHTDRTTGEIGMYDNVYSTFYPCSCSAEGGETTAQISSPNMYANINGANKKIIKMYNNIDGVLKYPIISENSVDIGGVLKSFYLKEYFNYEFDNLIVTHTWKKYNVNITTNVDGWKWKTTGSAKVMALSTFEFKAITSDNVTITPEYNDSLEEVRIRMEPLNSSDLKILTVGEVRNNQDLYLSIKYVQFYENTATKAGGDWPDGHGTYLRSDEWFKFESITQSGSGTGETYNFGIQYAIKETSESYSQGSYITDVTSTNASAYPTNGKHTDGYWYIKQ